MRNPRQESRIPFREGGSTDTICFLCQQAVEKYLKGYLILKKKKFGKIHDLAALLALCGKGDKEFLDWYQPAEKLTSYYIETRYPPDVPVSYTREEAEEALKLTKEILEFVKKKI